MKAVAKSKKEKQSSPPEHKPNKVTLDIKTNINEGQRLLANIRKAVEEFKRFKVKAEITRRP